MSKTKTISRYPKLWKEFVKLCHKHDINNFESFLLWGSFEKALSQSRKEVVEEAKGIVHDSRVCCMSECPKIHDEIMRKISSLNKGK